MKTFDDAFDILMGSEGGYVNHPSDPGGETKFGITKRLAESKGYRGHMSDLPRDLAKNIAKSEFWDRYLCGQLDFRIAFQLFDAAFNGGRPVQWLQSSVGVTVDGVIGANTVAVTRTLNPAVVVMRFNAQRIRYYVSLKKPEFINGWMMRIAKNIDIGAS